MFYQSSSRNQRPKGFRVNQVFQCTLLLVVIFWLLYSYNRRKEFGASAQNKLSEDHRLRVLGRKGNAGSFDEDEVGSEYGNPMGDGEKKEDGGGGDDELDRSADEKAEEESLHKGVVHDSLGNVTVHEEKENEEESETRKKERRSDEKDMSKEVSFGEGHKDSQESINNYEEKKDAIPKAQGEEPQKHEKETNTQVRDSDKEMARYKDKEFKKSEEDAALQSIETESATVPGQNDMGVGINGFHDQNGVPQDGYDILNSSAIEARDDLARNLHTEMILGTKSQNGLTAYVNPVIKEVGNLSQVDEKNNTGTQSNNMILEGEEGKSQGGSNIGDVETESEKRVEQLNIGTQADSEINSESENFAMSDVIRKSEATLESSRVLEDSSSPFPTRKGCYRS